MINKGCNLPFRAKGHALSLPSNPHHMATSQVVYEGELRTIATHIFSNSSIITDAPLDNHGKAEAFSPTDLVATALASCMLTVMGIKARDMHYNLNGTKATVTKIMASDPRRIAEVRITLQLAQPADVKTQKIIENTGRTCPVAKSLHPDLIQNITFNWPA